MGYRYEFSFFPSPRELALTFSLAADALGDYRPVWKAVADVAGFGMLKNIKSRGANLNTRWPDPSKRYARNKSLRGFGSQPLRRTGNLLSAFASGVSVLKETKRWALFGIAGEEAGYAKVLHAGRKPKGKLVKGARRFARFEFASWSNDMRRAYDILLGEHVERILDKAVGGIRGG